MFFSDTKNYNLSRFNIPEVKNLINFKCEQD